MNKKTTALMRLYSLLERTAAPWPVVCEKGCASCCTTHVTMTTLEGQAILDYLFKAGDKPVPQNQGLGELFRPAITTNGLARCCMERREPPVEQKPDHFNPCPFLEDNACTIYPVRPLGCRVMLSSKRCRAGGYAEMEDYWLTLNQVFLQAVEALDCPGKFGNMSLVLKFLDSGQEEEALLTNEPVPGLMIPREHQEDAGPVLAEINRILAGAMG
ncbi:MAG: YkgJ family cysteine cluster protein [Desulfatibacillum sp.]|nr:YkgJ family cysteine cluster protein [Desulfatibacillum sp.]